MKKIRLICAQMLAFSLLAGCGGSENVPTGGKEKENIYHQDTEIIQETVTEETISEETISEETTIEETTEEVTTVDLGLYDFTLCFAGDISLEEDAVTTKLLDESPNGLSDCISPELLKIMNDADYMCVNNEFTYSTRGKALPNKMWTFRANPSRVQYLHEMGADIALLANNHVYDYGKDAMLDTLDTLQNAGIQYFGAGSNLEEAMKPVYVEIGGKTIAYVAASRAEKNKMTPQATEDEPGILRCYDPELFIKVIQEADANADFVIANVHWGTERSTVLEKAQLTTGKEYIDAGADVIVGTHPHCLQGIEYYKGKPIIYSIGNFWFDGYTEDTVLLQLRFSGDKDNSNLEVSVVPAVHKDAKTTIASDESERERIFSYLESISINVEIDENGIVREKSE